MQRTSFYIALRYLFSKKKQNIINLISAISLIVVSCVAAAMVIILSAFNGIEGLVDGLYNKFDPDITITASSGKVLTNDSLNLAEMAAIPGVLNITSGLEEVAIISKGRERRSLCQLLGVDTVFIGNSNIKSDIKVGHFNLHNAGENYVIPGKGIAYELNLAIQNGDPEPIKVHAYKRGKKLSRAKEKALSENLAICTGAFSINADLDLNYAITTLEFAREIFNHPGKSSFIGIELKNENDAQKIKEKIAQLVDDSYVVKTRKENNPLVYETNESEKKATGLILLFIMLIAIFNGMASLTILMIGKRNDIKVLSSMGATWRFIKEIFLFEGILINVLGAIIGIILGLTICWAQMTFKFFGGGPGTVIEYYPVEVEWLDILMILGSVVLIGFIATFSMVNYLIGRLIRS